MDQETERLTLEADRIVLKSMIAQYEASVGVTKALPVTMPLTEAVSAIDRRLLKLKLEPAYAEAARRRTDE